MKRFDVLSWLRTIRDSQKKDEERLSQEEKIRKAKEEAARFRVSRGRKDSTPRQG